jgi:TRAP-type C4-dicarboxylate transport system permease small subunit
MAQFIDTFIAYIIDPIIAVIFSLAFFYFVYGAVKYFISTDSSKRIEARNHIMWSLLAFLIMLGVTAVLQFLLSLIGVDVVDLPADVQNYF